LYTIGYTTPKINQIIDCFAPFLSFSFLLTTSTTVADRKMIGNDEDVEDHHENNNMTTNNSTERKTKGRDEYGEDPHLSPEEDENNKMITKNSPEKKKGNPRGTPTQLKQRTSLVVRLYTNGIDVPLYGKLHKAQYPVSANTPEFSEVLKKSALLLRSCSFIKDISINPKTVSLCLPLRMSK
jgi:hypothetical protein